MNTLYAVPSIAVFLAKDEIIDEHDMSSVQIVACGGGFLRAEIQESIQRRLNCDFFSHYGMTETAGMILYALSSTKSGVTGRLMPGLAAKVFFVKLLPEYYLEVLKKHIFFGIDIRHGNW